MRFQLISVFAICFPCAVAGAEVDEECPDFGIESEYLQQFFCDQLNGILAQTGKDRSSWPSGEEPPEEETLPPWRQIKGLDEAYNRDPRKTLELIERIKAAGGLGEN